MKPSSPRSTGSGADTAANAPEFVPMSQLAASNRLVALDWMLGSRTLLGLGLFLLVGGEAIIGLFPKGTTPSLPLPLLGSFGIFNQGLLLPAPRPSARGRGGSAGCGA